MKYAIFYFSGTGNTWLAAKHLKKALGEGLTYCYSIENPSLNEESIKKILEEVEQVIIGYPIYGSEAPEIMKNFIRRLPHMKVRKPLAVFCTQAFMSGDGANYLEEDFILKGFHLMQTAEVKMSNNFYVPIFVKAFKVGDDKAIEKRNEKAFIRLNDLAGYIRNKEYAVKVLNPLSKYIGQMQRNHIGDYIKKVNEALYVDDTCVNCGLCVKMCPVENIVIGQLVEFKDHCIACMRCYQNCPKSAIQITEASKDLEKYPRFKGPVEKFNVNDLKV